MSFSDGINLIFNVLGCNNADIAKISGVDPSLISRFRTGARRPRSSSAQFKKLCAGIAAYANKNGGLERLVYECRLPGDVGLEHELIAFLGNSGDTGSIIYKKHPHIAYGLFSEKLGILMQRFGISNVRLARALNIDTSLVSRFKNGLRTPPKNSALMSSLCSYLYKTAVHAELKHELLELIGLRDTLGQAGYNEVISSFVNWMSDEGESDYTGDIDTFLEKLDGVRTAEFPPLPSPEAILAAEPPDTSGLYTGTDGLRRAVLRFLGSVAVSQHRYIIKLYSNKKLNWLSSDPAYTQKWLVLMCAVLRKKNQIRIIHNIERDISEMLLGIEYWLPLYMTGLIEGNFCKSEADTKFSHTLFIAPERAAIYGSCVTGTEETALYQYADTPEKTGYIENQFEALFAKSQPLVQVFRRDKAGIYLLSRREISKAEGNIKRLLLSPSLETIPAPLLERMLRRSGMEPKELEAVLTMYENCVRLFEDEFKNRHIVDYIVFPGEDELRAGKVRLNLYDAFADTQVFYTPEEYSEHIRAIISLLESSSYDIIPLPESPFANIQITVKESSAAIIHKIDSPITAFKFSHTAMCRAFGEYIDLTGRKSGQRITDKKMLTELLGRYVK